MFNCLIWRKSAEYSSGDGSGNAWFCSKQAFSDNWGGDCSSSAICVYSSCTLQQSNMSMENGPFIGCFPIKTSIHRWFSIAMFDCQSVFVRCPLWSRMNLAGLEFDSGQNPQRQTQPGPRFCSCRSVRPWNRWQRPWQQRCIHTSRMPWLLLRRLKAERIEKTPMYSHCKVKNIRLV